MESSTVVTGIGVANLVHAVAQLIVRRLAGDDALHDRVGFGRLIAQELG